MTAAAAPQTRKAIPLDEAMGVSTEDDRLPLKPGMEPFYITDVFFSTETKFNKDPVTGEGKLAKINAVRDPSVISLANTLKFRTAAGPMVTQLEKLATRNAGGNGHFRVPVGPLTVINQLSEKPGKNNEQVYYFKIVAA
jgi:hypothetical protein